jgi:heme exporter protein C
MEQRTPTLRSVGWLWFGISVAVLAVGFRQAIFLVPTDAAQGNVGRIFYYHVPIAMLSLIFPYINFAASLFYLYWRRRDPLKALTADALALSTAEVTVVYSSICLLTGMLWGRATWGIWWTWDPRLTSMLLLWLLYVSYLMLRRFSSTGQTHTLAAVLSVFAAVDVPIVYMDLTPASIRQCFRLFTGILLAGHFGASASSSSVSPLSAVVSTPSRKLPCRP